ncbi:hypothetical protein F0P96_02620 [Hymenobacter busanensis]|uniref:Uncharacterized protein n=1 Tax=Hymenobacter busanensis TaxID=2607656 RepID=A0A7L4ZV63_9BACT|nr:hypothetical protein [Hymenobacter busanensis]KAA9339530.1 hypothetical protein F0P96_02620 [Hymenobacter busanensis]QHJ06715.1 hypothetical protein GUY19_05135 [Hymenobacter busanensis]
MELLNFRICGSYIGIESPETGHIDLHNNFDFEHLHFEPTTGTLKLSWQNSKGLWAKRVPWSILGLNFTGVTYLHIKERDPEYPFTEDAALANICHTPPNARDEFETVYFNEDAKPDYDLTLYFQSEWGLKVNAATVRLDLEPIT